MSKYVVSLIAFDDLENHISNARYSSFVGVADTKKIAEDYVKKCKERYEEEKGWYRGWDRETYPQWDIQEVREINSDTEPLTEKELWSETEKDDDNETEGRS